MDIQLKTEEQHRSYAIKIVAEENGVYLGSAYLYIIYNDLHDAPYGLMENVFVNEEQRGKGIGKKLVQAILDEAKTRGCYKIIAQSRHSKPEVHALYEKFGFQNHGLNFRIDLV